MTVPSCKPWCFEDYKCPGESEGHDRDICEGDRRVLEDMSCDEMRTRIRWPGR